MRVCVQRVHAFGRWAVEYIFHLPGEQLIFNDWEVLLKGPQYAGPYGYDVAAKFADRITEWRKEPDDEGAPYDEVENGDFDLTDEEIVILRDAHELCYRLP